MLHFESESIHIHDMRVQCIVGVNPEEREIEQTLLLSLSFPADFSRPADEGNLESTVDYSAVAKAARAFIRQGKFRLLETLARGLGAHLCEQFGLSRLQLAVRKPAAIPDSEGAGVSLTVVNKGGGR